MTTVFKFCKDDRFGLRLVIWQEIRPLQSKIVERACLLLLRLRPRTIRRKGANAAAAEPGLPEARA